MVKRTWHMSDNKWIPFAGPIFYWTDLLILLFWQTNEYPYIRLYGLNNVCKSKAKARRCEWRLFPIVLVKGQSQWKKIPEHISLYTCIHTHTHIPYCYCMSYILFILLFIRCAHVVSSACVAGVVYCRCCCRCCCCWCFTFFLLLLFVECVRLFFFLNFLNRLSRLARVLQVYHLINSLHCFLLCIRACTCVFKFFSQ